MAVMATAAGVLGIYGRANFACQPAPNLIIGKRIRLPAERARTCAT